MTEKKKRGRPKKLKDAEVVPDNGPMMVNPDNPPPQEECGPITVAYKPQSITQKEMRKFMQPSEKLIPPAGLSKIDALQWLTAHRK